MNVEVNNESGVEIDAHGLMRLSRFVMSSLRLHPECELSIKLVDEDTMARYHVEFLDLPGPTASRTTTCRSATSATSRSARRSPPRRVRRPATAPGRSSSC